MTLKSMCTYAHCVTLGSRCKMASNHKVTDLEKIPVRISKDEAPTPLSVVVCLFPPCYSDHISSFTVLDLSAMFDTTDHDILLNCLRDVFGIYDTALAFFSNICVGEKQVVSVLDRESEPSC